MLFAILNRFGKYLPWFAIRRAPSARPRFVRCGYVHENGTFTPTNDEGSMEFIQIYIERPDWHRYVVMRKDADYILVDLYQCEITGIDIEMGDAHWTFATQDAAVAAAVLMS